MFDAVYSAAQDRLMRLATECTAAQLRAPVPATPRWTVRDLFGHLVGVAVDSSGPPSGAPGRPPSEEHTARQVSERADRSITELLAEWREATPGVLVRLKDQDRRPNAAFDIICHEADLHEALGLGRPHPDGWRPLFEMMVGLVGRSLEHQGTVEVRTDQGQVSFGEGDPRVVLEIEAYELLRGLFSRRSQRQIAAWNWIPVPPPGLERIGVFGAREDDQPIPTA